VLTSASLMVGEDAADDAIARARRLPDLGVGLHIVLAEGLPVSPVRSIPDLVDSEGRFPNNMVQAGFKFFFRPGVRRQLATEIRAQFERFRKSGLPLDHVNAHKHFHLHPTIASLILRIGRDYGLRALRIPNEPCLPEAGIAGGFGAWAMRRWTGQLRRTARRHGLVSNDQVFGLAWSGAMTEARLLTLIPHLPDGLSEIYFHPATRTTPHLALTMPSYQHGAELGALVSPRVRHALDVASAVRTRYGLISRAAP
jgi:hopanoid biosynthesis associated protein HpnK